MDLGYFLIYPILSKLAEKLIDIIINFISKIWNIMNDIYNNELFLGYYSYSIQQKTFINGDRPCSQIIGDDNNYLVESLKLWIATICEKTEQRDIKLFLSKYEEMVDIHGSSNRRTLCAMPKKTIYYDGLYFKYNVIRNVSQEKSKNNINEEKITIYSRDSLEHIKKYVDDIYEKFLNKYINFTIQDNQYFLELQKSNSKEQDENIFKAYDLKVTKTFDDLFFDNKQVIKKLLDDFENKKINKLALLLSGPPGTGKTSIIKAIINETKRCVISIKLNKIKNEGQLNHLIHCDNFSCEIEYCDCSSLNIPKNKRIYIFEDVDADSDILFDRTNKNNEPSDKKIIKNLINNLSSNNEDNKNNSNKKEKSNFLNLLDDLTLSDILNIFDGIREINESIIIFTTNHPEKLDPAFKRPGRITYHLEMKKITNEIAVKYIEYYFKKPPHWKTKDFAMTMAELEGFCRISETIDDLNKILEKENYICT